jgi:hypothetical protein
MISRALTNFSLQNSIHVYCIVYIIATPGIILSSVDDKKTDMFSHSGHSTGIIIFLSFDAK